MSKLMSRLAAVPLALGLVVAGASAAQAAPGSIRICTEGPSASASTNVRMENNYTGSIYQETISLGGVKCRGEGAGASGTSEPEQFHVSAGWCGSWQVNNGTWNGVRGGTTGVWTSIFPGEGYTGTWAVDVREWDC